MPAYTFHGLSDADFEDLARDLLQAQLGLRLQSFTQGKDDGIDLLNASRRGDTIVQCKHYWRSGSSALKRSIERDELPKIRKLHPGRYILCTSVGLTPKNKRDLARILKPYCRTTADILGLEDLNGLLRDHPHIERTHHKLWLTSVAVLERVLRNGAMVWNELERKQMERKLSLYVQTSAFEQAMKILNAHNYTRLRLSHSQISLHPLLAGVHAVALVAGRSCHSPQMKAAQSVTAATM